MKTSQKQRWAKEHLKLKDEIDALTIENTRLRNSLDFYARCITDNHMLITQQSKRLEEALKSATGTIER